VVADHAAVEGVGETAAPVAERDDEAVADDADSDTADQAVSDDTAPDQTAPDEAASAEAEPGTDGDEQTEEAGTAVQA
jgi:hypothetical protein